MSSQNRKFFLTFIITYTTFLTVSAQIWRSSLYPETWKPGYSDAGGRFLHDFSYAGYGNGFKEIPTIVSPIVDITQAPYNADNTGSTDVTDIVQQAINNLPTTGGVVYFPAGEYLLSVPSSRSYGVLVNKSNVVIRGAGAGLTKIKNSTSYMRSKRLFYFCADAADWLNNTSSESRLSEDVLYPTNEVKVEKPELYVKGDWVLLRNETTAEFIEEHKCTGYWNSTIRGVYFCRKVLGVNAYTNTLILDIPLRYPLKLRDNSVVAKLKTQLTECGMEDLSIGNVQHNGTGFGDEDYLVEGTAAYDVHDSHLIEVRNAVNCWFRRIHTYRPVENTGNFHTLSNGIQLYHSRNITVESCDFRNSQYEGGGGNGYMYILQGNECLLKNCYAEGGRHNYSFKGMVANGNVIYNCTTKNPRLATDFHMHLSMANLIDNFNADADIIDAGFRTAGSDGAYHMYTTTESVMWNTKSLNKFGSRTYVINSRQFGNGYVIGTSGVSPDVNATPVVGTTNGFPFDTSPQDFVEGVNTGGTLSPTSLYLDQLEKRKRRSSLAPVQQKLNVDFEDFLPDTLYSILGNRFLAYGTSITAKVVKNPTKSGINKSSNVLRIERGKNTTVSPAAVTYRGIMTDSYDIKMNQDSSVLEMKILKTTTGKIAARLSTDYNSEVTSDIITGSPNWQTVRLNFQPKISWSLVDDARLIIQMEKNSSPANYQTDAMIMYVDDIRLISQNQTSGLSKTDHVDHVKIQYNTVEKTILIFNSTMNRTVASIVDLLGKTVRQVDVSGLEARFSVSDLKTGAYILVCKNDKEIISTTKIIVK